MGKFDHVKVLESKTVYNKNDRQVVEDTLEYADGSKHEWVYFKNGTAVGIIALTHDNKIVLTKQYRHPLHSIVLNLPGGAADKNETLLQAARREFEEETGYTAEEFEWLGKFSPGPNTEVLVELFLTRNITHRGEFNKGEIVDVQLIDFKTMLKRILSGECFDSALTTAVLLTALRDSTIRENAKS
jgi:ADP-ribose pyrophosphatase